MHLGGFELKTDANTAALYHFNEVSGNTAADASSNSNTLASSSNSPWTTGFTKGGLALNGNSSLSAANSSSLQLGTNQSIEAMVKFNSGFNSSNNDDQVVVDKGSYKLYFDHSTGKLTYDLAPSSYIYNSFLMDNMNDGTYLNSLDSYIGYTDGSTPNLYITAANGYYPTITKYNAVTGQATSNSITSYGTGYTADSAANGSTLYMAIWGGAGTGTIYSCDMSASCGTLTSLGTLAGSISISGEKNTIAYQNGQLFATGIENGKLYIYTGGTSWSQIGGPSSSPASWSTTGSTGVVQSIVGNGSNTLLVVLGNGQIWKCILSGTACSSWTNTITDTGIGTTLKYVSGAGMFVYGNGSHAFRSADGSSWTVYNDIGGASISYNELTPVGTNLYATVSNRSQIWRCTNPSTTCSTWQNVTPTFVTSETFTYTVSTSIGNDLYVLARGNKTELGALQLKYNGSSWSVLALPSHLSYRYISAIQSMVSYNGDLYQGKGSDCAGNTAVSSCTNAVGTAVYARGTNDGTQREVAGNGINGSWTIASGTYNAVNAMATYGSNMYAGLGGLTAGDGEVWQYNGSSWTKVGGDGVNGSWSGIKSVYALATYHGKLYAGVGGASGAGDMWRYDGSSWTNVGKSGATGAPTDIDKIGTLFVYNDYLYIGSGSTSAGLGRIYAYTDIGGGGGTWINASSGSWSSANNITALTFYNGQIYAGLQSNGSAQVWRKNLASPTDTGWAQVGSITGYVSVTGLAAYKGNL